MMQQATETAASINKVLSNGRLTKLLEQKAALERAITAEQAKQKTKDRKADTRAKIIVGAAMIANMQLYPETRAGVVEVLRKAVTAPRDKELLRSRGLL